ncbi:trypsin-like peptidase domain-containing protein [Streptomyces sp. yr375]|uniref:nSTAND1 domain-containing NTPase n=1 Tax=Streptomyces sp. yr375 TaxID=1761906 RepID=UPI00210A8B08|nr:trypsin-like peptidase domain-containing protein [Streptomyces sp. yr375]
MARLCTAEGTPVGTGFLIAPDTVATCAHVVAQALGSDERALSPPTGSVLVEFPLQRGSSRYPSRITAWRPVDVDGSGDIALLELPGRLPDVRPVPLAGADDVWEHRFRLLGFPASAEHGAWIGGRLRGAVAAGWISMEGDGATHRIAPGCSGAPVWDEEVGGVVGMTVATDRSGASYLIPAAALLELRPGLRRCPYQGLDAFREEDEEYFFGRENDVERLLDAVDRHLVVPVVGPSGSGKTSLVRAGVVPRLRALGYTISEIRPLPGTRPSLTVARALTPLLEPGLGAADAECDAVTLADVLDTDGGPTAEALGTRLLNHCGPRGHVLFLNQLEEIVASEPRCARALLALVIATASATAEGRRIRVLATLRSASLDELADPGTAAVLSDCAQLVAPLSPAQLLRVIEGPATRVPGLQLEPGLAERIATDVEGEPGQLPMVEFAVTELWASEQLERGGGTLTHEGYAALGGVAGALSAHGERRVGEVVAVHGEGPVRRLFVQLARPHPSGGFTRVPARLAQLPTPLRAAAESLAVRTRFLRITVGSDGEPIADLAHEALTRQWEQLGHWLEDSREFRGWQEQVREQRARWAGDGRDRGLLLHGVALETALHWLERSPADVSASEREFIAAAVHHRRRGLRRWRAATAALALLSVISVVLAVQFGLSNERSKRHLWQQASQVLAKRSEALAGKSPSTSLQLALAAMNNADTTEARQALLKRYLSMRTVVEQRDAAWTGRLSSFTSSEDGRTVATASDAGQVSVWRDWIDGTFRRTEVTLPGSPADVRLRDDGCLLAASFDDGRIVVRPTGCQGSYAGFTLRAPSRHGGFAQASSIDFRTDGRLLLLYENDARDARAVLWDTSEGSSAVADPVWLPDWSGVGQARLASDGEHAIVVGNPYQDVDDSQALLVPLSGGKSRSEPIKGAFEALRDGRVLLSDADGNLGDVVNPMNGKRLHSVHGVESGGADLTGGYVIDGIDSAAGLGVNSNFLTIASLRGDSYYWAAVPVDETGSELRSSVVVPDGKGRIKLLLPVGSDLLVLAPEPTGTPAQRFSAAGWAEVRDRHGQQRLMTAPDGGLLLASASGGGEPTRRAVSPDADPEGFGDARFTDSGAYAVAWETSGVWRYRTPGLDARRRLGLVRNAGTVHGVEPLGGDIVAVLSDGSLERFDARTAKRVGEPVPNAARDCATACVLERVPGHPDRAAVLAEGNVRVWNLADGTPVGHELKLGPGLGGGRFGRAVAFNQDGTRLAAVTTPGGVDLWDVGTGRRTGQRLVESEIEAVLDFGPQGLLLMDTAAQERYWEPGSDAALDLGFPSYNAEAWRMEDGAATADVRGALLTIPLDPGEWVRDLCAHADRDFLPGELRGRPAGMKIEPPCAAHRKSRTGR